MTTPNLNTEGKKCICLEDNKLTQALCPVHGKSATPSHNTEIELKEIVKDIEDISPAWFNAREKQAIFRVLHTLTTNIEKRTIERCLAALPGMHSVDSTTTMGNFNNLGFNACLRQAQRALQALSPKE